MQKKLRDTYDVLPLAMHWGVLEALQMMCEE